MSILLLKNKTTPSDPYQELLSGAGKDVHFIPLLKHTHSNKAQIVEFLKGPLANADAFIVTSQRAVECFNECMQLIDDSQQSEKIKNMPGYTVGPATAEILTRAGFKDVRGGSQAGNGSILADIIISELETLRKIIFFTGEIRKDIIPKRLLLHGFDLQERVIYRTEAREDIVDSFERKKAHLQDKDAWIVFFSPQGTEIIVEYLQEHKAENFNIASIGPTTQEYLIEKGIPPKVVAKKPTAASLLEAMSSV